MLVEHAAILVSSPCIFIVVVVDNNVVFGSFIGRMLLLDLRKILDSMVLDGVAVRLQLGDVGGRWRGGMMDGCWVIVAGVYEAGDVGFDVAVV